MLVTVDASIWVGAEHDDEPRRTSARSVIAALVRAGATFVQPTLTLTEVAGASARRGSDPRSAVRAAALIARLPNVELRPLDADGALDAAALAAGYRLRGADAIYLTTAAVAGSTLLTLDQELLERAPPDVRVMTPEDWLASNR